MSTLYELNNELMELLILAEDDEVDIEALQGSMDAVMGEVEVKADGYAKVIRQLEADKEGIKAEAERLSKRAKAIDNNIKNMKKLLQTSMELADKPKFKTELFTFNIQKNPVSTVIDVEDITQIPEEYIKNTPSINKSAIKDAILQGKDINFAHLEQTSSLRIK